MAADRIPEVYRLQDPEDPTSAIETWIRAASGQVLSVFSSFMVLPLVEWGDDIKQWTAILAVWNGKGVIGLPAALEEYEQLKDRYGEVMKELARIRQRKVAPQGVIDSSEPDPEDSLTYSQVPKVVGYKRTIIRAF
jgi:hypothetical protein